MPPLTLFFLIATVATALVNLIILGKMANQLKHGGPGERRVSAFLDLPWIVREHNRSFPQSGSMLAFWLSVIFLVVWVSCLVVSLGAHI